MKTQIITRLFVFAGLSILANAPARAQMGTQQAAGRVQQLRQFMHRISNLPPEQQRHLSSGTRNLYHYAEMEVQLAQAKTAVAATHTRERGIAFAGPSAENVADVPGDVAGEIADAERDLAPVNNRNLDRGVSASGGFTQNESATAWCGSNVVVGYEDSGAYLRTSITHPGTSTSFLNVASSTNEGGKFYAQEFMSAGADPLGVLSGDPTVACSSASVFYYAAQYSAYQYGGTNPEQVAAIALLTSQDGGATWGALKFAVKKDSLHLLSMPWLAVDPSHPATIYAAYTDMDQSSANLCNDDFTITVELVTSHDGGLTWSSPSVAAKECRTDRATPESPRIAVDRSGKIYIAYEVVSELGDPVIYVSSSTDQGVTFKGPGTAIQVAHTGNGSVLKGQLETNAFPALAVDPVNSEVFVAWSDGGLNTVADPAQGPAGSYGYGDILLTRSEDGGVTWTTPAAISPTPASFTGQGRDQFQPSLAVDRTHTVAVCYYDRRRDPENLAVDRYCSRSFDHGSTWTDRRRGAPHAWTPAHNFDSLGSQYSTIGDYDTTVSDFTGLYVGFAGAFQSQHHGNADIFLARF